MVAVDEVDECFVDVEEPAREARDAVEALLGRRVEDAALVQRPKTLGLAVWHWTYSRGRVSTRTARCLVSTLTRANQFDKGTSVSPVAGGVEAVRVGRLRGRGRPLDRGRLRAGERCQRGPLLFQTEVADAEFVGAEVVGEFVANGDGDLFAEEVGVVAEVAAEGVAKMRTRAWWSSAVVWPW